MEVEEILDLVNEEDEVIGQVSRSEAYSRNLSNFRAVNAFIVNSRGELWIPRRTAHKKIFPNALDMSMGGHVESGESYEATFKREVEEELRLNADDYPWRELGRLTPADGASCFMAVYEIRSDRSPDFNPDDYTGAEWLRPQELMRRIEQGEAVKSDLPVLIKRFYLP